MLALYNFVPKFCPYCGVETGVMKDRGTYWDYQMRATLVCKCGVQFQRCKSAEMVSAAHRSEGDLPEDQDSTIDNPPIDNISPNQSTTHRRNRTSR